MESILSCRDICCARQNWRAGLASRVSNVTADFFPGQLCGVSGRDGCGKGLLLNILGLLETPDSGEVCALGIKAGTLCPEETTQFRNKGFGFVFSQAALLPKLTVAENVAMPLFRIRGGESRAAGDQVMETLAFCGCEELAHVPAELLESDDASRTSLARALVHRPKVMISISPRREERLLPIAIRAAEELGICILWAGDGLVLSRFAHRLLELQKGKITDDMDFR